MKKEQLKNILRPLIKEEVIRVVSEVLPELMAEGMAILDEQRSKQTTVSTSPKPSQRQSLKELMGTSMPKKEEIVYSSDPVLNEILKNTQGGVPMGDNMSPAMMMAEQYNNQSMMEMMEQEPLVDSYQPQNVKQEFFNSFDAQSFTPHADRGIPRDPSIQQGEALAPQEAAAKVGAVQNILNRDFRGVMKAMDAKKANSGPSNIDFSKL